MVALLRSELGDGGGGFRERGSDLNLEKKGRWWWWLGEGNGEEMVGGGLERRREEKVGKRE